MEEEDIDDEIEHRYEFEETTIQLKVKLLSFKNNQSRQSASNNNPPSLIRSIQDEDVGTKILQNNHTSTFAELIITEQKQNTENFKSDAMDKITPTDTDLTNETPTEDIKNNQFKVNSYNVSAEGLSDIHLPRADLLDKITLEIDSKTVKMKFDTGAALSSMSLKQFKELKLDTNGNGKLYIIDQDGDAIFARSWMKEFKPGLADLKDGNRAQAHNYSYPFEKWKFSIGAERLGRLHYRVTTDAGESWRRHADPDARGPAAGVPPAN